MPDPITMTGQYACRIAPYDQVRVICVDGPDPERPVAFYDAEGRLDCCDAYGKNSDDNYTLIPLRKPAEVWMVLRADGESTAAFSVRAALALEAELGRIGK